jgi:hypothetical protein
MKSLLKPSGHRVRRQASIEMTARHSITELLPKNLFLNHPVIEFRASSEGRAWSIEMTARHSATELLPKSLFLNHPVIEFRASSEGRAWSIEMTGLLSILIPVV